MYNGYSWGSNVDINGVYDQQWVFLGVDQHHIGRYIYIYTDNMGMWIFMCNLSMPLSMII